MPSLRTPAPLNPKTEMERDLVICLLHGESQDREAFDCGEPALNDYLRRTAWQHQRKRIANTYVLVRRAEPERILGFFTLSLLEVEATEIPAGCRKRLPPSRLPAARLGRLAVDLSCQGEGYGGLLLADAVRRVARAIREVAGVVGLFVDAKNARLVGYYQRFGFIPLEDNPLILMLPSRTILEAFSGDESGG